MDPETERHFAALIMEEAARLKRQAEKEGVHAYLAKPKVRGKPNPQFLKATVRSIAQANRAAEVNGMWKRRARELELEERESKKSRHRHKDDSCRHQDETPQYYRDKPKHAAFLSRSGHSEADVLSHSPRSHSSMAADCRLDDSYSTLRNDLQSFEDDFEDEGLKEEEMEQFLQSRVKRGRGAVGSRMDETGPYPSAHSKLEDASDVRVKEEWEQRILGPSREVFERQLVLEPKKTGKSKLTIAEAEDGCTGTTKRMAKRKEKKHRHSHKKSRKGENL